MSAPQLNKEKDGTRETIKWTCGGDNFQKEYDQVISHLIRPEEEKSNYDSLTCMASTTLTRFGPNRVAADIREMENLIFGDL